jgi:acetoin utilization protein AcuC
MIAIIYHDDYNKYDLGSLHPLIGSKPKKTMNFFEEKNILKNVEIFQAKKASEKDLLRVHNPRYLDRIKKLSKTGGMLSMDTPAPKGIYEIASLVTGGTKLAGEKLFHDFQCAINPLAGFHHASKSYSSGFCFFNDIAVVIEYLREKYELSRFLVIDLDVHHANGTEEIYYDDPTVLNISFHQDGETLYPGTGSVEKIGTGSGEGYTVNLPLPPGIDGKSYLNAFNEIIPPLTKQFDPEIIIYQSGVDTHHSDPLANLNINYQTYFEIGTKIMKLSTSTCKKLLVLFGGGYNSEASVISYFNLMCGFLSRADYFKENKYLDQNHESIQDILTKLKEVLSNHWNF